MGYAKSLMMTYNVLGMIPFMLMPEDILRDSWKGIKEAECPRRGPCTPTLEWQVGLIYLQVIIGMAIGSACVLMMPGPKGIIASLLALVATMTKHITVDGLIPPPPVMVMTAGVLIAQFVAPEVWSRRVFVGYCILNAITFSMNPLMVLTDTYPTITEDSAAYAIGKLFLEVVAYYQVSSAVLAMLPGTSLGLAYSWQIGLGLLLKHVLINKSGPPTPMIALFVVALAAAWYEVGWKDLSKKAETSMKTPMKLHAIIVATGFVPYFIAESLGVPFPFLGLGAIDASYTYTGSTAMLTGMLAIFSSMVAYDEYYGRMQGKMFAMYHYFLSPVLLFWQWQPTTSLLGVAFFMMPHMFTLWSATIVVSDANQLKMA